MHWMPVCAVSSPVTLWIGLSVPDKATADIFFLAPIRATWVKEEAVATKLSTGKEQRLSHVQLWKRKAVFTRSLNSLPWPLGWQSTMRAEVQHLVLPTSQQDAPEKPHELGLKAVSLPDCSPTATGSWKNEYVFCR